jgi:glycosyltransferase involved in cell wall biosynthesis
MLFLRVLRGGVANLRRTVPLEECDIFLGTNFRGVFAQGLKTIITVHDLAHEYYPEMVQAHVLQYFRQDFPEAIERADLLIADSENTRRDIIKFHNIPEEKVKLIHIGVDECFQKVTDPFIRNAVVSRYSLPERFMLMVGSIQPRKNIVGVLNAIARLKNGNQGFPWHLVLAGGTSWKSDDLRRRVVSLGLEEIVHFTGYVDETDLPALYSLSELLVFPSFYEGFGLPVLEAMACGVPVVTSNCSSLPEVAGDAAVLVDPHNDAGIAEGIGMLLEDGKLREQCVARGFERARLFSWRSAAEQTLKVFREITGK